MQLAPGDKLGPYEILARIGAGGMGEVYRARDPRLGREVAIKVSAERFSERFDREARAVAALNHPNICTIHDVGPNYLVMELVEGEAPQGPLPIPLALNYARQIGAALEAAHEKGIVHRDLKPANIKIKPDGTVKVLDFGLAKMELAAAEQGEDSPTLSLAATQAGVILGTAGYMSPEQARGKKADKRADIWAFGVILYEMLTGQRAFKGEEMSDVLASVLRQELDWSTLPARTSPRLRRLLARCLERDPRMRLRDVGEARVLIERILSGSGDDDVTPPPPPVAARNRFASAGWMVAAVMALAAAGLGWRLLRVRPPAEAPAVRFTIPLPENSGRTLGYTEVSPDGRFVTFTGADEAGRNQLWLRPLDAPEARALKNTIDATNPCWSPDGRYVAFATNRLIKKIRIDTDQIETVTEIESGGVNGMTWAPNGTILVALNLGGLLRVPRRVGADGRKVSPESKNAGPEGPAFNCGSPPAVGDRLDGHLLRGGAATVF